jgi:hypothetical protein
MPCAQCRVIPATGSAVFPKPKKLSWLPLLLLAQYHTTEPRISENNRIHLGPYYMQNRTSGPYLAAIHRILISVMTPIAAAS